VYVCEPGSQHQNAPWIEMVALPCQLRKSIPQNEHCHYGYDGNDLSNDSSFLPGTVSDIWNLMNRPLIVDVNNFQ
jgi:hypothetical protein